MIKLPCLIVIVGVLLTTCVGQWPLGPGFYRGMNQLTTNLNNMALRLNAMGERIAREQTAMGERIAREQTALGERIAREQAAGQANGITGSNGVFISNGGTVIIGGSGGSGRVEDDMRRAQDGIPFGNGGTVFITASGGLGYTYNSSDGSTTLYSLGNNSPPHGYMYHVGPYRTSFQNW